MVFVAMFLVLAACGNDGNNETAEPANNTANETNTATNDGNKNETEPPAKEKEVEKPHEPIELTIHAQWVPEEEFNTRWKDVLKEKFPWITIKWLPWSGENQLKDYITRGEIPDIIRNLTSTVRQNYLDMGLAYDMNELVKKYNYDLTRFNPVFIDGFKGLTAENGELYGLPVSPYYSRVLYYNKEIFDQFGEPYLTNGMTWDQIYDVARRLTREEGGIAYRGFSANIQSLIVYNEWSMATLDPVKDELSHMDNWQKLFNNYARFYQIPGNDIANSVGEEMNAWQKGSVAIWAGIFDPGYDMSMLNDWDFVSIPIIDGAPEKIGLFPPGYLLISQQSKHKEEAFQVIMEMLSDDVQLKDSRNGILTTLNNKEMNKVLVQVVGNS